MVRQRGLTPNLHNQDGDDLENYCDDGGVDVEYGHGLW